MSGASSPRDRERPEPNPQADEYVARLVRIKARQLVGRYGFTESDREDIEQELTLHLLEGVPEGVVRAEYCGIPCQARFDWVNPDRGIVDLKTCDDLTYLESDARRYGYAHQLAFYRALLAEVCGKCLPVYLVAVEKKEPFRCGVWRMGEDVLALAEKENREAIARLKRCRETDIWPTGFESLRDFDWL